MREVPTRACAALLFCLVTTGCGSDSDASLEPDGLTVDSTASAARATNGEAIYWHEHLIDASDVNGGIGIRGGDGLALADLDGDGLEDIVSVHEDSGHLRIAFASVDGLDQWDLRTLADSDVDGIEDVVTADLNRDGYVDVLVACEDGHVAYFQNPGRDVRSTETWASVIPEVTRGRGSFIRVSVADMNGDGRLDVIAANKGLVMHNAGTELTPSRETILATLNAEPTPISVFLLPKNPLDGNAWIERELGRLRVPMNSQAIDLDGDGDIDIIGGGRGELTGLVWFENLGSADDGQLPELATQTIAFDEESRSLLAEVGGIPLLNGWMLKFYDFNDDGRLDILTGFTLSVFGWLEQPEDPRAPWRAHVIGDLTPDHFAGLTLADIDGDGAQDLMVGGYSKVARDRDTGAAVEHPLGRIAWYRAPDESNGLWERYDISRRTRGMFDDFIARDFDGDGDVDFAGTRGNSDVFDGVFWLEQRRSRSRVRRFLPARQSESAARPLP